MRRNTLNLVVDVLTFIGLMVVAVTGLLMKFVLPSGSPRMGLTLFGWDRHDWGAFHFWATVGLGVILVVHLALHWRWVCTTVGRIVMGARQARLPAWERNVVGVGALVIVVGVVVGLLGGARMLTTRGAVEEGLHRGSNVAAPSDEVAMDGAERGRGVQRRAGQRE